MAVISEKTKKVIKGMAVTAQTAQFISLMPKPKDFVTRLVGDVVYLSAKVQSLSENINKLLDQYANIPTDYIMTQINSITSSATSITNRLSTYDINAVTETLGVPANTLETISTLTDTAIDTVGAASKAVTSLSLTVAHTSTAILGQEDVATEIHDASEVILEWTNNKFETISSTATAPLNQAVNTINNIKTGINNKITNTQNAVNEVISQPQKWVESLLSSLKSKMDKLSSELDTGFKDVTGVTSISKGASYVTEALSEAENKTEAVQATSAVSQAVQKVLDNFSIAKVIKAFGGVLVESVLVKTCLNELPPIDFETMLKKITTSTTTSDLIENDIINETNKSAYLPSDFRNYNMAEYKEYLKQYDDVLKQQRTEIRNAMKSYLEDGKITKEEEKDARKKMKSAIKEVKKFRNQIKNAKQSSKLIDEINTQLDNLKKEAEYKCNSIKSDWNDMMKQYRKCISDIKKFFQNGGDGDMQIDDYCEKINKDCDKIKELCKSLTVQMSASVIKVGSPTFIGPGGPNPAHHLASFWMDIKTIYTFIKDMITLVVDIMKYVNKLARIMLNGLNNLDEIVKQLFEMLGLQWFMDLIQSIIDMFGGKISDAKTLLANMVSPVYYEDTDEYSNTLETLESMYDEDSATSTLTNDQILELTDSNRFYALDRGDLIKAMNGTDANGDNDKLQEILDAIDDKAEELVAYKSPILDDTVDYSTVSVESLKNGTADLDSDVKFKGWVFYHPNLDHISFGGIFGKLIRKIKNKIIKKASKTGNKKRGGVNMLKRKKVKKQTAYEAFYWYTYYTEDLDQDCFDQTTAQDSVVIDSTITTENGTIVQLSDGRKVFVADNYVKSGDYVNVDGVKYRVK